MCDTLGRIVSSKTALFAKNSDRSPNEPQVVEYRAAKDTVNKALKTTYTEIEQSPYVYAALLSRPVWMWGAEMGVNEHGVCIGNEAVFTKGKYGRTGLTGMDLVRLGLERGGTANQAMEIIIELLEQYGQGGNCGYDHNFYYDNAFLIMDRQTIYLLQTAGKNWVYKQVQSGSISNRLSIGADGDKYSGGTPYDFTGRHLEPLYSHFSGSKKRLEKTADCLHAGSDTGGMISALRSHRNAAVNPLAAADVASPCMHAGGIVGDHTTASMVVKIGDELTVWLTGSSTPCISLFKPWRFGSEVLPPVFKPGYAAEADAYWRYREMFHRKIIGHTLPAEFYAERDALEEAWRKTAFNANAEQLDTLTGKAVAQEAAFYQKWEQADPDIAQCKRGFRRYWKKTSALMEPVRPVMEGD